MRAKKKKVQYDLKQSSLITRIKVHFLLKKRFTRSGKKSLGKFFFDEKGSFHISSEGSLGLSGKVHLAYPRRFRKFLFSLNRNRFLFS